MVIEMVQGYKTINIKEEVIYKIRDLEENRNAIEQDRFNLAGFVSRVLLEYMNKEKTGKEQKKEGLTLEEIKNAVKELLTETKQGNITTTDLNAGITIEDLKRELIKVEIETVGKIKDKIDELKSF